MACPDSSHFWDPPAWSFPKLWQHLETLPLQPTLQPGHAWFGPGIPSVKTFRLILFLMKDSFLPSTLWTRMPSPIHCSSQNCIFGTSLVAQRLRIHLPTQGTRVPSLVWEDPTCRGATKPMCHNYWACALEPASHNYSTCAPRAHAPQQEKPPQWEACTLQWRVAPAQGN